jgi:hypothetical protein
VYESIRTNYLPFEVIEGAEVLFKQ